MGQSDIIDWLRDRRLRGGHRFFYRKELESAMSANGLSVLQCRQQLNKLYVYHYLEVRFDTAWTRRYRLKRKYISLRGG